MLTRNKNRQASWGISEDSVEQYLSQERCRICLQAGEIPIFGKVDISENVSEFGGIELSYDDNLPHNLCAACHSLLEAAVLFRNTAKKSEQILKNTDYLEDASMLSEDQDYNVDKLSDTDNETYIKREYLELDETSESESEIKWNYEQKFEDENLSNIFKLEAEDENLSNIVRLEADTESTDGKEINMQLIKVNDEDGGSHDVDNELVMIIVSDKDKPNQTYICEKCNIAFDDSNELDKHTMENHQNIPPNKKKCDICSELIDKTSYKLHLKQHRDKYKAKHDKKYGKVECEVCGKKVNKSYYKYHLKMHGTAEEQADRFVECVICNKAISAHYFGDHMKRIHDKKPQSEEVTKKKAENESSKNQKLIKCPVCDKKVTESIYKGHLAKHGGSTRRYICDQCGKIFKHASAFKTHILTHGSELKYQCQFCPYRGLHLGLLKIHVRTHTGDYNYRCTECPARFITKSNLSKHLQRHQGACNFKCTTCNRGFYSKRAVDKHVKTVHLDLKTNVCDICGKGFGHRDNMLSHQLKVHKRKKITERRGRMPSYLKEELMKSNLN